LLAIVARINLAREGKGGGSGGGGGVCVCVCRGIPLNCFD